MAGHVHDWEGVTVIFQRDPKFPEEDWFMATGVIFNRHGWFDYYDWKDVITVFGEDDIKDETLGAMKKHPKAYVGFYSHSAFREKCDGGMGCSMINMQKPLSKGEYRSSDWYRLVPSEDLRLWDWVHGNWLYGDGLSTPWLNHDNMCNWDVKPGFTNTGGSGELPSGPTSHENTHW